jgi:6-phosphofructokinase 1
MVVELCEGMNATVRALTRLAIDKGHEVYGIRNGLDGLLNDDVEELKWMTVNGWAKLGIFLLPCLLSSCEIIY